MIQHRLFTFYFGALPMKIKALLYMYVAALSLLTGCTRIETGEVGLRILQVAK